MNIKRLRSVSSGVGQIKTCEFVSPKHPDKICDFIADSILDECLKIDKFARVAVEVMGGHGLITLNGEVTMRGNVDYERIVKKIVGKSYKVIVNIAKQSPFIASGVDTGGAGDQGIMNGYASADMANFMPLEYELARNLCKKIYARYPYDGKTQVTIKGKKVTTVVASFQNTKSKELEKLVRRIIKAERYLINPAGEWTQGGFDADSGLSGRKLVVDNYGPEVSIGGGSFSGKDPTKVDRSGAYMARKIAVDYLKKYKAKEVRVKLAYAIGVPGPVMAVATVDGVDMNLLSIGHTLNPKNSVISGCDLTPAGIMKTLRLRRPIY
ncbi:MAG: methionine adenosyltransferase domain-containing protein, partial [Candidatus Liptonbacteria bacterium]|nr:methionine adenosyltransferase domain-containing protein [Candidatus Liptonbacteria bacterium]